ncbi:hypothetical protein ACNPKZ_20160 [Shewanella algae]|uniref:hypothetical protein n=1 Tax=Shewanella algae TaxID=38313 RepID=UPI000B34219C|nr:hypothetical protein KVP08_022685 [Shewanella putrefaciens]
MDFESGKTYLVKHQRKGTFAVRVSHQRGEFTYGVIVGGQTTAIMADNEKSAGDEISFRTNFVNSAVEQPS